jgi:geranylgeranyl reductase family protein
VKYDVIIVGAGPAGSTAAARLAKSGARVLLLEQKRMPREKLCGEFITPECFPTLRRLGVIDQVIAAGAHKLTELCLCLPNQRVIRMPIAEISDEADWALSLSRARLDQILLQQARQAGAICLEGIAVKRCLFENQKPCGVEAIRLGDGKLVSFKAQLIIDASGRNSRLTVNRNERVGRGRRLYAMKAHLEGVRGVNDQVELHFFPEGYGGLSRVENGLVNLCFIASELTLRRAGGNLAEVMRQTIMTSELAREHLIGARVVGRWYTAGPLSFGKRDLSLSAIIAIGDSAGMIDPFTGTGIQVAMRSGEIAAEAIIEARSANASEAIAGYCLRYECEFGKRMVVAGLLRRAVFSPRVANLLAEALAKIPLLARSALRATRISQRPPA